MNYIRFCRTFRNIRYEVAIPDSPTFHGRKFRILMSLHGTRKEDCQIGAISYIEYPLNPDFDDPFWYDLVVIAPHFPASNQAKNSYPNGDNFPDGYNYQLFDETGLQWLHDLVHVQLPLVFSDPAVNVGVETDRFYFFGHSRGGMAVHTYIMRFKGQDIFRAASCGGKLKQRDHSQYNALSDNEYLEALDAFLSTPVASILGTEEGKANFPTGRDRIESVRSFICREVAQRVSVSDLALVSPLPPVSLGDPAINLTCDLFTAPAIAARSIPLPSMQYRFLWNKGIGHSGEGNYKLARDFLFQDRVRKSLFPLLLRRPLTAMRKLIALPRLDKRKILELQLEEQLDINDPGDRPGHRKPV